MNPSCQQSFNHLLLSCVASASQRHSHGRSTAPAGWSLGRHKKGAVILLTLVETHKKRHRTMLEAERGCLFSRVQGEKEGSLDSVVLRENCVGLLC